MQSLDQIFALLQAFGGNSENNRTPISFSGQRCRVEDSGQRRLRRLLALIGGCVFVPVHSGKYLTIKNVGRPANI
jgi:hypothetical protein